MMVLIALLKTTKDRYSRHFIRFVYHHFLETTFKSLVFFEIFLVFVESGCSDRTQFAAGKCRFKDIGGIHRSFPLTGSDECVNLIYKEDDLSIALRNLVHDGFQPLLKFTLILGSCHKGTHVE